MRICTFLCVVVFTAAFAVQGVRADELPTPCRERRLPCGDQEYACATEESYQSSLIGPQPGCPVTFNATLVTPPPGQCLLVNGSCQYSTEVLNCTVWLPECEFEYQCGTVEAYSNYLMESPLPCPFFNDVPPPSMTCVQINESCQWYNPCRMWQTFCSLSWNCGTTSDYWAFVYGPQPLCVPPPPGFVEPIPPGECIVQERECSWSNCRSWLNSCQTQWQCGTQYQYLQYQALPPPPCPFPGEDYQPPDEPGECIYDVAAGSCQFAINTTCPEGKEFQDCGTACPLTCDNFDNPPFCTFQCVSGCFCPSGLVEDSDGGGCVEPSQCSPTCPEGKEYQECGTACPLTCDNYNNPPFACTLQCVQGCFCPDGLVEDLEGGCVEPSQCTPTCPEGKEYQECGTACPLTCDNYNNPPFACTLQCVQGCFCPDGLVEDLEGGCVEPSQCSPTCPEGKEYQECGTACPLTCDNYNNPPFACTLQCVQGCFCQDGLVQYGENCVEPSNCPIIEDPCALVDCVPGYRCIVSDITGQGICDPSCDLNNGECPANQICRISEIDCGNQPCDNYRVISCEYPVPGSCQPGSDLCPSNSHCLTFNTTQDQTCLRSCFLDNGGCGEDQVCVTVPQSEACTSLSQPCSSVRCVDREDLEGDCPPGFEFTECDVVCQTTCDNYEITLRVCPAVCVPGCICPQQLARYRDRCVDPLECPALLRNPPPINPLPQPDSDGIVLIQLTVPSMNSVEFTSEQGRVVSAVRMLMAENGYPDVTVSVYAVVEEDAGLQVVLQITTDETQPRRLDEDRIAALIADGSDSITVEVAEVSVVEVPSFDDDDDDDEDHEGLSEGAIAGIAIGALVFGSGVVSIAVLIVYCFIAQRKTAKIAVTSESVEVKETQPSYSKLQEIASLENEYEES